MDICVNVSEIMSVSIRHSSQSRLANLYRKPLDHGVNGNTSGRARRVRYADDFVIACVPGRGGEMLARLKQSLPTTLNHYTSNSVTGSTEKCSF
jgi:hypothetical protein